MMTVRKQSQLRILFVGLLGLCLLRSSSVVVSAEDVIYSDDFNTTLDTMYEMEDGFDQMASEAFLCPLVGEDPINVPIPNDSDKIAIKIQKKFKQLCMLVRVTAKNDEADLDTFTLDSPSADFAIAPIARTYSGIPWAVSAGPYALSSTRIKCQFRCTIRFPLNKAALPDFRIYIMSMSHAFDARSSIARFLEQATFGPTKAELDNWPYTQNTMGMAKWTRLQMNSKQTPMTLHREFYRERMDSGLKWEQVYNANFRPQHPCDQYSRWRDYALTGQDYGLYFEMREFEDKLVMYVFVRNVWEARTVMDTFENEGAVNPDYSGVGSYQFCWSFGEGIGQPITYRPTPAHPCKYINGGNPRIYLPDSSRTAAMQFLDLPSIASFDQPPGQLAVDREFWLGGEGHRMLESQWDVNPSQCDALKNQASYGKLFGIVDGADDGYLFHYSGYAAVEENTIQNPMADGGAEGVRHGMFNCINVPKDFMNIKSCKLSTGPTCVSSSIKPRTIENNVVVCGSSGEVANKRGNPNMKELNMAHEFASGSGVLFGLNEWQKSNLFNNIALWSPDQLRQRMAWALSQILVVTQFQINDSEYSTEFFLHYHDIFVRNAFGNYRDVLKEVSYSPMMGEMLSFLDSRSATYVKRWEDKDSRPDENFAREIMQLFSIGIYDLRPNGIPLRKGGKPVLSYENTDIQNFARAWTGFRRRERRGNTEGYWSFANRIDPMTIQGEARDMYPKSDLSGGYVGDRYPLCTELPAKHFLRRGASYRLLGGYRKPEYHYEPDSFINNKDLYRPLLDPSGALYNKICNDSDNDGTCDFRALVNLHENFECTGFECDVDNLRVIKVQDNPAIYYEYVRPACVEFAFSPEAELKKVVDRVADTMCVNEKIDQVAMGTCCPMGPNYARSRCEFTAERVSFATSAERCLNDPEKENAEMCDWLNIHMPETKCEFYAGGDYFDWYWTNQSCTVKAKVNSDGMVALVHNPNLDINDNDQLDPKQKVVEYLNEDNTNYYKVPWNGKRYPNAANSCGDIPSCVSVAEGCLCDVEVKNVRIFSPKKLPTKNDVWRQCKIGSFNPIVYDDGTYEAPFWINGVKVYHKIGEAPYSMHTVFSFTNKSKRYYFKNQRSLVSIPESTFKFRNSPHFLSLAIPDERDAVYETEAVLDVYFYHPNMPPFLAERLIQRFEISNPSPGYVQAVATAFTDGVYKFNSVSFGKKVYGDLGSTVAAILLHKEARTMQLDADPTAGSLREPFLKYIGFLRSMEYLTHEQATAVRVENLQQFIGQAPYTIPNVFSFFLPEYSAPGDITKAELKSPEAMVLNAPTIIGFLNGVFSLIDIGTSSCYSGFGGRTVYWCPGYLRVPYDPETHSHGRISFKSTNPADANDVIDELATLLTSGRLNSDSRAAFVSEYTTTYGSKGEVEALRLAQKLVLSTPEYHSTNTMRSTGTGRVEAPDPVPSPNEYKAIVFLNLNGGNDGFNMLVPRCSDMFSMYQAVRGEVALPLSSLRPIDATGSGQPCDDFGLHTKLSFMQSLYNDKDLSFIANLGILQEPLDKSNWTKMAANTALFAHNTQTEEAAAIDIFDEYAGIGVGGRILDVLSEGIYNTGSISVAGAAPPVVSTNSPLLVVNPVSYDKFNPVPWAPDVTPAVKAANPNTVVGSGLFAETWSDKLFQSLGENKLLYAKYNAVNLSTGFPSTHHGKQLASIAKLIQTKDDRGKDRDIFFSEREGYDLHFDIAIPLDILFKELDDALRAFVTEMRNKGLWEKVTVVCVSEFGRTLMGNTGSGTDHAWGSNYFIASGSLDGGKIMGEFPSDLTNTGPHAFSPGIVIPTTPWESVWNAVSDWFGVAEEDMDKVLPNRGAFPSLWTATDFYSTADPNNFDNE